MEAFRRRFYFYGRSLFGGVKEGKMDSAIGAHFGEEGVGGEVVRAGMFEDEEASGAEQIAAQDGFGELG